jgi:hypothetical protein
VNKLCSNEASINSESQIKQITQITQIFERISESGFTRFVDLKECFFVGAELDFALFRLLFRVESSHDDKCLGASTLLPTFFFRKIIFDFVFIMSIMV